MISQSFSSDRGQYDLAVSLGSKRDRDRLAAALRRRSWTVSCPRNSEGWTVYVVAPGAELKRAAAEEVRHLARRLCI